MSSSWLHPFPASRSRDRWLAVVVALLVLFATAASAQPAWGTPLVPDSTLEAALDAMQERAFYSSRADGGPLMPDETAPDDPDTPADETLDAALAWLRTQR